MADRLTYGRLRSLAAHYAAAAAVHTSDDPAADLAGICGLLQVTARHSDFLARPFNSHRPAAHLARVLESALDLAGTLATQQPATGSGRGRWGQAGDTLAVAHDLLASQVGPGGQPRGPDAETLTHHSAVDDATRPLTGIVLTAALAAEGLARTAGPTALTDDQRAAAAALAPLVTASDRIRRRCGRTRPVAALDDVAPLLGDVTMAPAEKAWESLRFSVRRSSTAPVDVGSQSLMVLALLAGMICDRTNRLFGYILGDRSRPDRAGVLVHSEHAAAAWKETAELLRMVESGPGQATHLQRQARAAAHQLRSATDPLLKGKTNKVADALTAIRSAVLVLPDLAITGLRSTNAMIDAGAFWTRAGPRSIEPLDTETASALRMSYRVTVEASRRTLAVCLTADSGFPHRERAQHILRRRLSEQPLHGPLIGDSESNLSTGARRLPNRTAVRVETFDGVTRVHDTFHGTLRVNTSTFSAALTQPAEVLRDALRSRTDRIIRPYESPVVLAALAVIHAPEIVTNLRPAGPLLGDGLIGRFGSESLEI